MKPQTLAAVVAEFAAARREARQLDNRPPDAAPRDVAEGWRIQAELAREAGGPRGWKVGAVTPEQQAKAGVTAPIAGRLLAPWFHASPAALVHARFVRPLIECEIAFRIGRDLPPRPGKPYTEAEIVAAIDALVPAIEVADSRLPPQPPTAAFLADQMANGAFVHGAPVTEWRKIDRPGVTLRLTINGADRGSGRGDALLRDPLHGVVALANFPPPGSDGLRRGEIVTTGALAPVVPIAAGERAIADFGPLGRVEVAFA